MFFFVVRICRSR